MFQFQWAGRSEDFTPELVGDATHLSPDERDVVNTMLFSMMEVLPKLGPGEVVVTGDGDIPRGASGAPRGFSIAVEVHPDSPTEHARQQVEAREQ